MPPTPEGAFPLHSWEFGLCLSYVNKSDRGLSKMFSEIFMSEYKLNPLFRRLVCRHSGRIISCYSVSREGHQKYSRICPNFCGYPWCNACD